MSIRNKLIAGFSSLLLMMMVLAGVGIRALDVVRRAAHDATSVGGRLNSFGLEIQVHSLEAQRQVANYMANVGRPALLPAAGSSAAEAEFEIHEMESLAARAASLARRPEHRDTFGRIASDVKNYANATGALLEVSRTATNGPRFNAALATYDRCAEQLRQSGEDGEVAGRDASQSSQDEIRKTGDRAIYLSAVLSFVGVLLAIGINYAIVKVMHEHSRMSAELELTQRLQRMLLPRDEDFRAIQHMDVAGHAESATEVGGDYYDVAAKDGGLLFSIGDVAGHGLESGVIAIMVQTAIRTLLASGPYDSRKFFDVLNRVVYDTTRRMNCDRHLTLSFLQYQDNIVTISGQHEEVLIVRNNSVLERHDTLDLGFPLGLEEDISTFIAEAAVPLNPGDVLVVYTDGITEAFNSTNTMFGIERLSEVVKASHMQSAAGIRDAVIRSLREHMGKQTLFDDVSLLVVKPA